MEFEGVNRSVDGKCPTVTFSVSTFTVTTNNSTDYEHMSCRDLERRERLIRVVGSRAASGLVTATLIERSDD